MKKLFQKLKASTFKYQYFVFSCNYMDLKELLEPDREKIKMSVTIITMSILLAIFSIYFTGFHSLDFLWIFPGVFLIIIYYFIFPLYYPWIYYT